MRRFSRATGAAAIAFTLAPNIGFSLKEIRIHLSAAGGAGDLTATINSAAGPAYDVVLINQDMTAVTDIILQPAQPHEFEAGDELLIAWANANTRTYGIEVVWSWSP